MDILDAVIAITLIHSSTFLGGNGSPQLRVLIWYILGLRLQVVVPQERDDSGE